MRSFKVSCFTIEPMLFFPRSISPDMKHIKGVRMITIIQNLRMVLYDKYRSGLLTLEEYIEQIRPLDQAIDTLELNALNGHLQDKLASEKLSLKHLP